MWPTESPSAALIDLSPRLNGLPQQLRQLGDVGRDPPRLVAGEQFGRRPPSRFILAIDESKCLLVAVADDEARRGFLDGPGRPEAALRRVLFARLPPAQLLHAPTHFIEAIPTPARVFATFATSA